MKKLTLSFLLAVATASFLVIQAATPATKTVHADVPFPTCPPLCPPGEGGGSK